ncbi:MAG: choice-of-anchor J domain-containing protein [Bacteroidaceae bacterium]|nr:choice-of-anchor J domain-containing protein [Bacteroidaceae bacterium]
MKKIKFLTICAISLLFAACADVPEPYGLPEDPKGEITPQGDGSVNNPYNVAALDSLFENEAIPTDKIYARGIVSQIDNIDTSYGNATYFISDDGKTTKQFEIYRGYGLGGEKFKTGEEFQVGDTLVVYGQVVLYGSTREFTTGSSIYSINAGQDVPPTPVGVKTLPYQSSNLYNDWSMQFLEGSNNPWIQGNTYTQATGYQKWGGSDTKSNKEVEGYLVSPAICTKTDSSSVSFSFDYTIRYENNVPGWEKYHKIYATTNPYDANSFVEVTWTPKASTTNDWTLYTSGNIALPSQFVNKDSVYVMFYFYAPASGSTTWELENFNIFAGSGTSPKPGPDPKPVGDNLIANGDFETWSSTNEATCWKSTTTASTSGAVSQSTDAHSGTYAAKLGGNTAKNQRIAYKEITLQPGTYNIKFYAKSTGEKSSINPGYAYNSGSSMTYVYTDYVDVTGTWTEVSKSITLAAQTTINLVIMNSKNPGTDVLIDDYSLTTSDGGIIGGDTPGPTPGPTDNSIPYSIDFTSTQGDWTINDVNIASGLNYVWQQNSSYGMKASGYYQQAFDTESWLISPQFEIPAAGATLILSHAMNYLNSMNRADCIECKVSTDKNTWTTLELSSWPSGSDFTFVDATASLSNYAGKKIYIAFQYKSTSSGAITYEIKTLSIK